MKPTSILCFLLFAAGFTPFALAQDTPATTDKKPTGEATIPQPASTETKAEA
jgi:hypothetical protein